MHESHSKNTEMLNELNGLIDQNSRLVKELDEMRGQVKRLKDQGPDAVLNEDARYTEEEFQEALRADRASVSNQLSELQNLKKKLKKEEDNRRAFSDAARKREDEVKRLQQLVDKLTQEGK